MYKHLQLSSLQSAASLNGYQQQQITAAVCNIFINYSIFQDLLVIYQAY